ncbi:hypothetical protein AZI85_13655 [Bdellovibrio bacteriovorus]|uniref:Uncharacterized protein n=1 Tax=Bdellovibrio bacteriovorus TaxID=959 RepID=A0A150WV70_BDEBC|nr:hypothetical protein AZI85_13655 [Bdellovibrio bacteriovorus]
MSAGFQAPIDPLSGMSADLVLVDKWLGELKSHLESKTWMAETEILNPTWASLLAESRNFLSQKADAAQVKLYSLNFREERHWSFSWDTTQTLLQARFSYAHYLESLPLDGKFELLKINFIWKHDSKNGINQDDYRHEGFKLLKSASQKTSEDFFKEVDSWVGKRLPSQSFLEQVKIEFLTSGHSLILP